MAKGGREQANSGGAPPSTTHLLHRSWQTALDFHAEAAGPGGLTQRQYTLLTAVARAEGRTQSELVRATGIDRSTLAELVGRMLARGFLERERSAADARANTVRLSKTGAAALAGAAAPAARAEARLLALLSPKKRDSLVELLTALVAAAEAPAHERVGGKKIRSAKKKKKKRKGRSKTDKAAAE
ncbi:MAG: MarR family winged helix-turn-helix transcriptional regulator [Caulobacteraceae bacterium]